MGARRHWIWWCLGLAVGLIYLFMIGPIMVVLIAAFSSGDTMEFPPAGWSLRWFAALAGHADFLASFRLSLGLGLIAAAVATVSGALAAYGLVRYRRPCQAGIETLLLAPLYVPRVLIAMALLLVFAKLGLAGSLTGMIIGHALIALPFVVRTMSASLAGVDPAVEEAARCLGATWRQAFVLVTLPLVRSGLAAGAVFAFIVSFTDVYLALFIAGPETITLPLRIFTFMEWEQSPMVAAVSTAQVIVILVVMALAEKTVSLSSAGRI
ncbi:MAG: ABC transporter permease [Alphaproteobacteria bacterium]|nr:ABC transporter permease [Alphaproteobacteria bacterium]